MSLAAIAVSTEGGTGRESVRSPPAPMPRRGRAGSGKQLCPQSRVARQRPPGQGQRLSPPSPYDELCGPGQHCGPLEGRQGPQMGRSPTARHQRSPELSWLPRWRVHGQQHQSRGLGSFPPALGRRSWHIRDLMPCVCKTSHLCSILKVTQLS